MLTGQRTEPPVHPFWIALLWLLVALVAAAACVSTCRAWGQYKCDPYTDERATHLDVAVCPEPGLEVCAVDLIHVAEIPCRWRDHDRDGTQDEGEWGCTCEAATPALSQIEDSLPPGAWLTIRACGPTGCAPWALCPDGDWCGAEGGPVECFEGWPGLETPCQPEPVELTVEAESGILTLPFEVVDGMAVWAPPSSGEDTWPCQGRSEMVVEIPEAGRYAVWARVWAVDGARDAAYLDGTRFWPDEHGRWSWKRVHEVDYPAGEVTLVLGHGEPEVRIDRLWLSTDLGASPPE